MLHYFTGSTVDVRMLGKYLHQHGYTCHAPLYKGHRAEPEALVQTVAGCSSRLWISLGGLFSLEAGAELPVNGVVSMCAPIKAKRVDDLYVCVLHYAKRYRKFGGKDENQAVVEWAEFQRNSMPSLKNLQQMIMETSEKLDSIPSSVFVLQGPLDDSLYRERTPIMYQSVHTAAKQLKWYEQSGRIITLDKERKQVYEDISIFLHSLNW